MRVASRSWTLSPPAAAPDAPDDGPGRELEVRVAGELPGDLLVGVDDDLRARRVHHVEGEVAGGDEAVAAEHEVRRPRVEANCAHVLRPGRDPHVARHRPALLGHAELVDGRERDAFEVGGHGDEGADGDPPRCPPTPATRMLNGRPPSTRGGRSGSGRAASPAGTSTRAPPRRGVAPWTLTKLGQKPSTHEKSLLQADWSIWRLRPYSVSRGSTERQFDFALQSPQPSQTRWLMNVRRSGSAIAPRLRRRRFSAAQVLVVDEDAHPPDLAKLALDAVEVPPVGELRAGREHRPRPVLLGLVGHEPDGLDPLPPHLAADRGRVDGPVMGLPAGHRHRVVEEDLVGDVDPGRDARPDREEPGVVVGAVAEGSGRHARSRRRGPAPSSSPPPLPCGCG